MYAAQRLFFLSYLANLMNNEPGTQAGRGREEIGRVRRGDVRSSRLHGVPEGQPSGDVGLPEQPAPKRRGSSRRRRGARIAPQVRPAVGSPNRARSRTAADAATAPRNPDSDLPFTQSVFDAGVWINGTDADLTTIDIKPGVPRDMNILPHANVASPGPIVPRQFLTVLSKGDTHFQTGFGPPRTGQRIFSDAAPLAARVIVNRVWAWHFGKPLVATPSDFGAQGEKPTHPELLDDLAARFIANGWSLKWLQPRDHAFGRPIARRAIRAPMARPPIPPTSCCGA